MSSSFSLSLPLKLQEKIDAFGKDQHLKRCPACQQLLWLVFELIDDPECSRIINEQMAKDQASKFSSTPLSQHPWIDAIKKCITLKEKYWNNMVEMRKNGSNKK